MSTTDSNDTTMVWVGQSNNKGRSVHHTTRCHRVQRMAKPRQVPLVTLAGHTDLCGVCADE